MDSETIHTICEQLRPLHQVKKDTFSKYNVKRGLRNADGTGVMAGITRLGNVHGYLLNEGEREPIEGKLTYRGIDLYDLLYAFEHENRFGFGEVGYLLLSGSLPTREAQPLHGDDGEARALPDNFTEDMIMRAPSPDIMNKLASATLALYSYDPTPDDISTENILRQGIGLMAKFPVIISHAYQARRRYFEGKSMFLHEPDPKLSTAENILRLIRPDGSFTDDEAKLLDRCLIIHAEHGGGNNSAFTAHVVSSSGTDTYSAIAAAVGSLKGPRHGGANLKVVQMFNDIKAHVTDWSDQDAVYQYLLRILAGEAGDHSGLIYGMGHAIYTLSDPRDGLAQGCCTPAGRKEGLSRRVQPHRDRRAPDSGCLRRVSRHGFQGHVRKRRPVFRVYIFTKCWAFRRNVPPRCSRPLVSLAGLRTAWRKSHLADVSSVRRTRRCPSLRPTSPSTNGDNPIIRTARANMRGLCPLMASQKNSPGTHARSGLFLAPSAYFRLTKSKC